MNIGVSLKKILGRDKLSEIISLSKENSQKIDLLSKESSQKIDLLSKEISAINSNFSEIIKQYRVLEASMEDIAMKIPNSKFEYINSELLSLQKTDKGKILIVGFYGAPNLGDELMLETLLQYLQEKKDIEITIMLCDNPDYDIRKYQDVNFIHYPRSMFDINYIAGYFDTVIFGGGAIIDDSLYNETNPNFADLGTIFIELSMRFIKRRRALYCVGLSSNLELKNNDFIKSLAFIVEHSKHFSLRDKNSFITFDKSGINTNNLLLFNDISLGNKDIKLLSRKNKIPRRFGINMICNEETEKSLEILLDYILKEYSYLGISIELIPFYEYNENDSKYYKKIIKKSKYKNLIKMASIPKNMSDLVKILERQDIVVSMRYHCALTSLIMGIPTLIIYYESHRHYFNKIYYLKEIMNAKIINYSEVKNGSLEKGRVFDGIRVPPKTYRETITNDMRGILDKLCDDIATINYLR